MPRSCRVARGAIDRSHLADVPYVVYDVYWVCFPEQYQEGMSCGNFENASFRLSSQGIIVSVAPYEARAASFCESYAEFHSRNRTRHSLKEVFNGLYEASVPKYCTGALVFFDCYAFEVWSHGRLPPRKQLRPAIQPRTGDCPTRVLLTDLVARKSRVRRARAHYDVEVRYPNLESVTSAIGEA